MKTPLVEIKIKSIYNNGALLPQRMARCTPDTLMALIGVDQELQKLGGNLVLSDLMRSYDMQYQSNLDYKNGKKKAYSPSPGGSMHEAGRAIDLDLSALKISLKEFWVIAQKYGLYPIIKEPKSSLSEAWHFDCRGSHQKVYEYYSTLQNSNFKSPYAAMAASAILEIGEKVDRFPDGKKYIARVQSGLIRLDQDPGIMDGLMGMKTRAALTALKIYEYNALEKIEDMLQEMYPQEYKDVYNEESDTMMPEHLLV